MLLSGSAITYGSYRLLQYLNAQDHQLSYDEYMQREDVVATLSTLERYLAAKKKGKADPYKELRQQFTYVCKLHVELTELIEWRKEKIYRYIYWSGETKFVKQFQDEWAILMSRLRLIKALLYLDKNVL